MVTMEAITLDMTSVAAEDSTGISMAEVSTEVEGMVAEDTGAEDTGAADMAVIAKWWNVAGNVGLIAGSMGAFTNYVE